MIKSKVELPLVLETPHIQEFLDIGRRQTYDLLANPPFHVNRVGKFQGMYSSIG